jgi:hypothetical protein
VRREAANVLPIIGGMRQCGAAGVHLGQCRHISMGKLGSIITSALPVATVLICQRACIYVGVCVGALQCEGWEGWEMHGVDIHKLIILRFKRLKRDKTNKRTSTPYLNTASLGQWGGL